MLSSCHPFPSQCKILVNSALISSSVCPMNSWWLSLFPTLTCRVFWTLSLNLIYTVGVLLRYSFLKKTPYYCVTFFCIYIFLFVDICGPFTPFSWINYWSLLWSLCCPRGACNFIHNGQRRMKKGLCFSFCIY